MRTLLSTTLLLVLAAPVFAATPINQTRPLSATGHLQIDNVKGRIQVRAWDRNEVKIEGSLGAGVENLEIDGDSNNLSIKVRYPKNGGWGRDKSEPTDLLLTVPRKAELEMDSVSANVDVQGIAPASLSIDSVSGDVLVVAEPGNFSANSVSGKLDLTINSASVDVQSVSGNIVLRGRMGGKINASNVSGGIDIAVNGERIRKLSTDTVSGNTKIRTALTGNGKLNVESVSGSVMVALPKDLSARVTAETFSGNLRIPGVEAKRPKYGPGANVDTRYGNGDGQVSISTFSGNAELRLE
jgi:DUF4097 and DUF4098 domain-containing protein YvlB